LPATDGLFLGETLNTRRWDVSKLINLSGSQISDVLLLNGSRAMAGDLDLVNNKLLTTNFMFKDDPAVPILRLLNRSGSANGLFSCGGFYSLGNCEIWGYFYSKYALYTDAASHPFKHKNTGGTWEDTAKMVQGAVGSCRFDIPQAGDITIIDDRFLKVGKDSDGTLPTPCADYRGKIIRVEGATGTSDKLYCCMKKTDDTYEWVQVASG
jgi:hypothetical protein